VRAIVVHDEADLVTSKRCCDLIEPAHKGYYDGSRRQQFQRNEMLRGQDGAAADAGLRPVTDCPGGMTLRRPPGDQYATSGRPLLGKRLGIAHPISQADRRVRHPNQWINHPNLLRAEAFDNEVGGWRKIGHALMLCSGNGPGLDPDQGCGARSAVSCRADQLI
jgi:hypothetical protein